MNGSKALNMTSAMTSGTPPRLRIWGAHRVCMLYFKLKFSIYRSSKNITDKCLNDNQCNIIILDWVCNCIFNSQRHIIEVWTTHQFAEQTLPKKDTINNSTFPTLLIKIFHRQRLLHHSSSEPRSLSPGWRHSKLLVAMVTMAMMVKVMMSMRTTIMMIKVKTILGQRPGR